MQSLLQLNGWSSVIALTVWAMMAGAPAGAASSAPPTASCASGDAVVPGGCVKDSVNAPAPDPVELLERVREKYATLESYSDTGVVTVEERPIRATLIREQHRFTTRYKAAPRSFLFDFRKGPGAPGERFAIWSPGGTFSSWWSATGVKEDYARGEGANAFAVGSLPTSGTALLIPALLFRNAGLQGPLVTLVEPKYGGTQKIDGRLMHVLTGAVPLNHWGASVRVTSIWVDAQTLMIRKIFEDTPTGQGDIVQRTTTTFEPKLGVALDDAMFVFIPPK